MTIKPLPNLRSPNRDKEDNLASALTFKPSRWTGLNNQKYALLGLVVLASLRRCDIAPPRLWNLTARNREEEDFAFSDVFDIDAFTTFVSRNVELVREDSAAEVVEFDQCFAAASALLRLHRSLTPLDGTDFVAGFFGSLRPAQRLEAVVCHLLQTSTPKSIGGACQLRIEQDYQAYAKGILRRRLGTSEDFGLSHVSILSKIKKTAGFLPAASALFVTADEERLRKPLSEIADWCDQKLGFPIVWKTSIDKEALSGLSSLEKSLIDMEVTLRLPKFAGTTRSTFCNVVAMTRVARPYQDRSGPVDYIYNAPVDYMIPRLDDGTQTEIRLATGQEFRNDRARVLRNLLLNRR